MGYETGKSSLEPLLGPLRSSLLIGTDCTVTEVLP